MKASKFFNNIISKAWIVAIACSAVAVSSCDDDDDKARIGEYLQIEGFSETTSADFIYEMGYAGIDTTSLTDAKVFTVRSNGDWAIVPTALENGWCRIWPAEGSCDGLIRVSALENKSALSREMTYNVILNGIDTGRRFIVKQKGSEPYIRSSVVSVTLPRTGGSTGLLVLANIDFDYMLTDENGLTNVPWLTVERVDDSNFKVSATGVNDTGGELKAVLTLSGKGEFSGIVAHVPISQTFALISDDLSWVPSVAESSVLGWDTAGESVTRYGSKPEVTAIYDEHGWESRANSIYARPGFIKIGKTNYGGDAIAPKMAELGDRTANVEVHFQAVGYTSAGGTFDWRVVYVGLLGDGKIVEARSEGVSDATIVPSVDYVAKNLSEGTVPLELKNVAKFELTEDAAFLKATDPTGLKVWEHPDTKCVIKIEGATKNTRVVFIGNKLAESLNPGKNRIFLDNYIVLEN